MINIYQLHSNPEQLKGYDQAHEKIPELIWKVYQKQPIELKKREHVLAKDPMYAFIYADLVLKDRFPEGEAVLAQHPKYAYRYADDVLEGRFSKGEDAIAQHPRFAYMYAKNVLKDRFPKGEDIIKQYPDAWFAYKKHFGIGDA